MPNSVWVYVDQFKGTALAAAWEALGAARQLAAEMGTGVTALVLGHEVETVAQAAIQFGADDAILCDDATLADFRVQPYAAVLTKLAAEKMPQVILGPATTRGRDVFGYTAAALETGAISDATGLALEDGAVAVTRPVYAGKLIGKVVCREKRPQFITVRPRAFPQPEADAGRTGEIERVAAVLAEDQIDTKVVDYAVEVGKVTLGDAKIVVSGGRGVGGPEGFAPVAALAEALGGALGASRAAVDAGWIPYSHQVGQTGKTVTPDLYIACGISGAIQHQAGMRTAKLIVAINKDKEAPIFKLARYGVVGDLFQIVPALTEEFKKRLGK